MKLQNPDNRAFAQMFQKSYAGKILECHLNLLNVIRTGGYLPDRVTNLVLQYLSNRCGIFLLILHRLTFHFLRLDIFNSVRHIISYVFTFSLNSWLLVNFSFVLEPVTWDPTLNCTPYLYGAVQIMICRLAT